MPKKLTEEKEVLKTNKLANSKKAGTKATKSQAKKPGKAKPTDKKSASKSSSKKNVTTKPATKKNTTKKQTTKKQTTKKVTTRATEKKVTKNKIEEKIDEQTVIEKIKAFLAKIVAMQEEVDNEDSEEKVTVKTNKKKTVKKEKEEKPYILEYYDLPYRYNETVVKILAQTPKRLFVYWDISDNDRQKYLLAFGENFFNETYPVLLVHNEDMNYTFEVPINDFANSWYLDINDSKSKYTIQLGRKFRSKPTVINIASTNESVVLHNDYVPIITSNILEVPNDHILFENMQSKVLYRNVKTGVESTIDIDNLEFAKKIGHIYSIYDIYKEIYENELDNNTLTSLLNPSSMSSSVFR